MEMTTIGVEGNPTNTTIDLGKIPDNEDQDEHWMNRFMPRPSQVSVNPNNKIIGIDLNPRVFFLSLILLWSFIIWANVDTDGCREETSKAQNWITKQWGWIYTSSLTIFMIVMFYLMFSKYGDLRLAKDENDKPDFTMATWFSMLFSAGIGIGLFFWGVAEPVLHYGWVSRVNHNYMQECTDNKTASSCFTLESRHARALWGMNIAWFHWGLAPSATYLAVGLPIAYYHYKYGRDLTMRTGLWPLLGNRVNGWIGDLAEVSAIIGTMFGVCTSLGLGVQQIAAGLQRMDSNITNEVGGSTQIWIIWLVTIIAMASVVTGLHVGIRRISELTFILGTIVLAMILFMGNTWFIIDFFFEELGFHINHLPGLSLASQGFEIWWPTASSDLINTGGFNWAAEYLTLDYWAGSWTIFYWAWWVSWAPFVGLFIARISKGRTIRQFVLGNMVVPTILSSVWFTIFGGAGLNQQIQAENAGMTCSDCEADGETYINGCQLLICRGWSAGEMFYDLLELFPLTNFMTFISTVSIILYFVTSSDSASSTIDQMASNGNAEGPMWQRIFWAVTEGATAHTVLAVGGKEALQALRSVSIIAAMPFCILMLIMVSTFVRFLATEDDPAFHEKRDARDEWGMNIFDAGARVIMGTVTLGATGDSCLHTSSALLLTPYLQSISQTRIGEHSMVWFFGFTFSFLLLVVCTIMTLFHVEGAVPLVGVAWVIFVAVGVSNRMKIRERLNIRGTWVEDFVTFMCCGPFAAYQEFNSAMGRNLNNASIVENPKVQI
jgi:choline/carnitine/betaine transport